MGKETLEELCAYVCTFQNNILNRSDKAQVIKFRNEIWSHFIKSAIQHIENALDSYIQLYKTMMDTLKAYEVISDNYNAIFEHTHSLCCLKNTIEFAYEYYLTGNSKNNLIIVEEIIFFKSQVNITSCLLEVHKAIMGSKTLNNNLYYENKFLDKRRNTRNDPEIFTCLSLNGIELLYEQFKGEIHNMTLDTTQDITDPSQSLQKSKELIKQLKLISANVNSSIRKVESLSKTTFNQVNNSSLKLNFKICDQSKVF